MVTVIGRFAELAPMVLTALPRWILVGIAVGLASTVILAVLFVLAERYDRSAGPRQRASRSGDDRRRMEIREYLAAIDERYVENHVVEGQRVAFFLPERDVAITFDARAYYRIEGSGVHPVLVEHEMPGLHLEYRLPFDAPTFDATADTGAGDARERRVDAERERAAAAFAELGVPTSASLPEVRDAYRRRVKEVHPDQGGDEEAFRRVREAYTTAKRRIE